LDTSANTITIIITYYTRFVNGRFYGAVAGGWPASGIAPIQLAVPLVAGLNTFSFRVTNAAPSAGASGKGGLIATLRVRGMLLVLQPHVIMCTHLVLAHAGKYGGVDEVGYSISGRWVIE
jgi:hypothetical protein